MIHILLLDSVTFIEHIRQGGWVNLLILAVVMTYLVWMAVTSDIPQLNALSKKLDKRIKEIENELKNLKK